MGSGCFRDFIVHVIHMKEVYHIIQWSSIYI